MSKLFKSVTVRYRSKKTGQIKEYTYQYKKATKILVTKTGKINKKNFDNFIKNIDDVFKDKDTGKFTKEDIIEEAKTYVQQRSKLIKNALVKWDKHRITESSLITHLENKIFTEIDKGYNSLEIFLFNAGVTKEDLAIKYGINASDIKDTNVNKGILTVTDKTGRVRRFELVFTYDNDAVLKEKFN